MAFDLRACHPPRLTEMPTFHRWTHTAVEQVGLKEDLTRR